MRNVWTEEPDWSQLLWRYMKTERFLALVGQSQLHFASANQFIDPFEGAVAVIPPEYKVDPRYAEPSHSDRAFKELKRLTKLSCWHKANFESDLMWRLYAEESKGVAICTTPARIRDACELFRLAPTYGHEEMWFGDVKYIDLLSVRLNAGMLERFYAKHLAFAAENEFRLAISLRMAEEFAVAVPELGINVDVNLEKLIERVVLGPALSPGAREQLEGAVKNAGLGNRLMTSAMLGTPRYI